ncbi:MAG TPA: YbaK/EbsC family protein [Candidatus Saccharimonadales bacterium]|nr:YbaK/EbsC family protein [Candidatus Saccharimonadales bacterium]
MKVLDKIISLLNENCVSYKLTEHEQVHTSAEAAAVRGLDLSTGAKALVMFADKKPIMIVVPGHKKVDLKKFKSIFGFKDIRMATGDEVLDLTGLLVGAIPPLGSIFGLPTYYDEWFKTADKAAFNPGSHTHSIIMSAADLIKVENPIFGPIT